MRSTILTRRGIILLPGTLFVSVMHQAASAKNKADTFCHSFCHSDQSLFEINPAMYWPSLGIPIPDAKLKPLDAKSVKFTLNIFFKLTIFFILLQSNEQKEQQTDVEGVSRLLVLLN